MLPLDPVEDSPVGPFADRSIAVSIVLAAAVFVWFLWQVEPDVRGHGTHEQLGMEECGFVKSYGMPCPTCGVTTSGAHLVRLHVIEAVVTQPFGAALGGFGLWISLKALWCLFRRRSYVDYLEQLPHWRLMTWGFVLLLLAWLYKYLTFDPS